MNFFRTFLLPVCCLLGAYYADAQASAAINQYLMHAGDSQSLFQMDGIARESSWVEDADLRYSGNDQEEHSIALRFRPRFASQRQAENRIYDLLLQQNSAAADERLNDEMARRYLVLIDLFEIASEVEFKQRQVELSRDALAINRRLVETESFQIADLQSAEVEYQNDQQQFKLMQRRLTRMLRTVEDIGVQALQDFLQVWPQRVGSWEQMLRLSGELLRDENESAAIAGDQIDFQLAQQKLSLARSESKSWLKFVEIKLTDRPTGDQETSLGLAIPLGGDYLEVSERAMEVSRSNVSLQINRLNLSKQILQKINDLQWYQDREFAFLNNLKILEQQFSRLRDANQPQILLRLKSELLSQEAEIRRNYLRGLRDHIELLHATGYLTRKPLTNWLLREQPRLQGK